MNSGIESMAFIAMCQPKDNFFYTIPVKDWILHNREELEKTDKEPFPSSYVFPLGIYDTRLEAQQACMEFNKKHTSIINI